MQIPPCPNSLDHKHVWKYNTKQTNKRARGVYCANCPQTALESANGVKYITARTFSDVKTVTGSFRTWKRREKEMKKAGYKSIRDYIDNSPIIPR